MQLPMDTAPWLALLLPGGHCWQKEALVDFSLGLKVPAGHRMQLGEAGVL